MLFPIIHYQSHAYSILRILNKDNRPNINAWKEYYMADLILEKEGILYILRLIPDAEIISEVNLIDKPTLSQF